MKGIVAIDIGTTSTKVTLVNKCGHVFANKCASYSTNSEGSRVEQDPREWWEAICTCLKVLMKENHNFQPVAVTLSGQMQNVILVNNKEVLYPAILYSDMRAKEEARIVQIKVGEELLHQITCNIQDASSLLAKLLWIKKYQPKLYQKSQRLFIGAHDYIAWKLCGAEVTDFTTASVTGMLDLRNNTWAKELMSSLNLRIDWLPDLIPAEKQVGTVNSWASNKTCLPLGVPVFHGAGDAATTTLGSGAGEPGPYYVYLGTSGWIATTYTGEPINPNSGIFNLRHPDSKRLILIGPMLTAAGNFEWLVRNFGKLEAFSQKDCLEDAYIALNQGAASSPYGSNGVLYLPCLAGERSPFRDPDARGIFFGLKTTTTRQDLYRSVLEGVAFSMRTIAETMIQETSTKIVEINLVGGGGRSPLWAQIFADILNCQVKVLDNPEEVGARGAMIIVGRALGWYETYFPTEAFFPVRALYKPRSEAVKFYGQLFTVFKGLYPALKPSFSALNKVMKGD